MNDTAELPFEVPMHAAFTQLLAVWLLTIAVGGWCCPSVGAAGSGQALEGACCASCNCSHSSPTDPAPSGPRSEPCQGACVYTTAPAVQLELDQSVALLAATACPVALPVAEPGMHVCDDTLALLETGPPLRRHLVFQILLI